MYLVYTPLVYPYNWYKYTLDQHAYVYIHELARESLAAASEVEKGGGKTKEAGPALRRLRSWGFLQSLLVGTGYGDGVDN